MKGKLKWIVIVVVVIVVLGAVAGGGSGDKETKSNSTASTTETTDAADATEEPEEEPQITYTPYSVTELENDLDANALSASDKYKDQYVELTGRLGTIDSDGKYISILDPEDEWDMLGVHCKIKGDDQLEIVKTLTKDSGVIVKGKITSVGEVMGYSLDIDEIAAQ